MRQTILDLFNAKQTKSYTLQQVSLSEVRPGRPGDHANTWVTVSTRPEFNVTEQWSVQFNYNRVDIGKIATAHPTIHVPYDAVWLSDALFKLRPQWGLNINPEDFVDVLLPTGNGPITVAAQSDSIGLVGCGAFDLVRDAVTAPPPPPTPAPPAPGP